MWADALGEQGDDRQAGIDRRCSSLLDEVGEAPFQTYASLRAVDARVVVRLEAQLRTRGSSAFVPLLDAVANAARENLRARRAADAVKGGYAGGEDAEAQRAADKATAAAPLRESEALRALLAYHGPAAEDARAIALVFALDRMEIARGLPKHLKVYAVEGAFYYVFGVAPPKGSAQAAAPIPTGTWRTYLERVATAAGHPVPASATDVFDRETYAWTGVLSGFADRLAKTHPAEPISDVSRRIDERIATERAGAVNAAEARKARR